MYKLALAILAALFVNKRLGGRNDSFLAWSALGWALGVLLAIPVLIIVLLLFVFVSTH